MKKYLLLFLTVALGSLAPAAQESSGGALVGAATTGTISAGGGKSTVDASGTDESDRLRQLYMAKRAELLALRNTANRDEKNAGSEAARKRVQQQLATAEKPLVDEAVELARKYNEAKKQKTPAVTAPVR